MPCPKELDKYVFDCRKLFFLNFTINVKKVFTLILAEVFFIHSGV